MIHELKIKREYFDAVANYKKTFEVRRNDRDFKVGDYLGLNEYDEAEHTGRSLLCQVVYILDDAAYCKEGYVVMGIKVRYVEKEPFIAPCIKILQRGGEEC